MTEQNKPEGAAKTKNCSFCSYERNELEEVDNGLEKTDPRYSVGQFCTVCMHTRGLSAYMNPWDFRLDMEQIRILCYLENARLDSEAHALSHLQYIRTMTNEHASVITALVNKIKNLEERLARMQ